jgi:ADP-ribose pyrophosphatase YjhB (NUDIX family)
MAKRNSHCSFCGATYAADQPWPRTCAACKNTTYQNPLPVAVLLLPVDGGLLTIRRGIPPHVGELALPGGYVNLGESWQTAAARELREETGITIDPVGVRDFCVLSAPDGTVLIFGEAAPVAEKDLPAFTATDETSERVILRTAAPLAFPLHTQASDRFFARK